MSTIVFGIKNCDTVKKARKWLDQHSIEYVFSDFREQQPDAQQIRNWIETIGLDTLVNKRSTTYRQLDAKTQQSTNTDTWISQIEQQPTLIKRPLLNHRGDLHCGFKESRYEEIFNG